MRESSLTRAASEAIVASMVGAKHSVAPAIRAASPSWLALAIVALAVGAVLARMWLLATRSPDTPFLERHAPAEWIVYPSAPNTFLRTAVELPATFARTIELARAPQRAALAVRVHRAGGVRVNGTAVELDRPLGVDWKRASVADVAALLRAGQNRVEVEAIANAGPPALWLALDVDGTSIVSDPSWIASWAGATERPARLATTPMSAWGEMTEGSVVGAARSDRWSPRALDALRENGLAIAAFAVVAGLIGFAWSRQARSSSSATRDRWVIAWTAVAALSAAALFWRNRAMDERQGFDAVAHIEYVDFIAEHGRLPLADEGWEMYQPPLYYVLARAAIGAVGAERVDSSSVLAVRAIGWLALAAQIALCVASARILFPDAPRRWLIGGVLATALPMQLYLFQYVSNEGLAAALVSASVYCALWILREPSTSVRAHALLGALLGAALLAKFSALLAIAVILGVLAAAKIVRGERDPRAWLATIGVAALAIAVVAGWHYARVWRHFGSPIVGNWDARSGFAWWLDPGYRTIGDYLRFGASLDRPIFSALHSVGDALYSSLWCDGMLGGSGTVESRPPWNYGLMCAGAWLALAPCALIAIGLAVALIRLIARPRAEWFLLLGLLGGTLAALLTLTLELPFYAQAKSVYAASVIVPLAALLAVGFDWIAARGRVFAAIAWIALGAWAINSYASFWSPERAAREQSSDPEGPQALTERAGQARAAKDLELAAELIERAIGPATDRPVPMLLRAQIQSDRGDLRGAITSAREVVAATADNAPAHRLLGVLYLRQGDLRRALEHLELCLRIQPAQSDLLWLYVDELSRVKRWRQAVDALERSRAKLAGDRHAAAREEIERRLAECKAMLDG